MGNCFGGGWSSELVGEWEVYIKGLVFFFVVFFCLDLTDVID